MHGEGLCADSTCVHSRGRLDSTLLPSRLSLAQVRNPYLLALACLGERFIVDGCPRGLSGRRFAAAAGALGSGDANAAWLERQGGVSAAAGLDGGEG